MFEIIFKESSKKEFLLLEKDIQKRIKNSLNRLIIRPQHYLQRLVDYDAYKLRVGNYRLIIDLDFKENKIIILKIGHRSNIYKKT